MDTLRQGCSGSFCLHALHTIPLLGVMTLLILGGTEFLGRYLVHAGTERGHRITLFNRGQTNRHLFPDVEKLRGDRGGDLSALSGRKWDAVIDTCGYLSSTVRATASLLAN